MTYFVKFGAISILCCGGLLTHIMRKIGETA